MYSISASLYYNTTEGRVWVAYSHTDDVIVALNKWLKRDKFILLELQFTVY